MGKKLAVLVVHGIGTYAPLTSKHMDELSFSKGLKSRIVAHMQRAGRDDFEEQVAWREVHYSHIFQRNQRSFLSSITPIVRNSFLRRLMVHNIADAAAYRFDPSQSDTGQSPYERVHSQVARALGVLEKEVEPDAPLIILAHSLGGFIVSNYLWDQQADRGGSHLSGFQKGKRLCALITFGCNIPLFLLGLPRDQIEAPSFPGDACDPRFLRRGWWWNYFDRDDSLGFPLGRWGKGYEKMNARGELKDQPVNVGKFWRRWNLLSHNEYWTGRAFSSAVANHMTDLLSAYDGGS